MTSKENYRVHKDRYKAKRLLKSKTQSACPLDTESEMWKSVYKDLFCNSGQMLDIRSQIVMEFIKGNIK